MNEEENDGTIFSMLAPQTEFDGDLTTKAALYQRVLQKVVQKNQFFGGGSVIIFLQKMKTSPFPFCSMCCFYLNFVINKKNKPCYTNKREKDKSSHERHNKTKHNDGKFTSLWVPC